MLAESDTATLVAPTRDRMHDFLTMAHEFAAAGDLRYALERRGFRAYLESVARFETGKDLPADQVPMSQFWLIAGDTIVGGSRLRHRLSPTLQRDGGNIGYDIRPSMRGRGLGHVILRLTLEEARARGLARVLFTCEITNDASMRVIERAGGVADGRSTSPVTNEPMRRYWIALD